VKWEPQWFQITYALTIAPLHRYYVDQTKSPPAGKATDLEAGRDAALALTRSLADTWLAVDEKWRRLGISPRRRAELASLIEADIDYYLAVLAGAIFESDRPAALASVEPSRTGRERWKWLAELDRQRDLAELVAVASKPSSHADAYTLYNIACLRARMGQHEEALTDLQKVFDHLAGLAFSRRLDWLREDPTLHPLRTDERCKAKFELMVATLEKRLPKPPAPSGQGGADRWAIDVPKARAASH